jgi:hypothetical protein
LFIPCSFWVEANSAKEFMTEIRKQNQVRSI